MEAGTGSPTRIARIQVTAVVLVFAAWSSTVDAGLCWNLTYPACTFAPESEIYGKLFDMGMYHRCLEEFDQQYCVAKIHLEPTAQPSPLWDSIKESLTVKTWYRRDKLTRGVCVPRAAGPQQVATGVQEALRPAAAAAGVAVNVTVAPGLCQAVHTTRFDAGDIVVGCVVVVLLLLMIVATAVEGAIRCNNKIAKGRGVKLLLAFSMISNWSRLMAVNQRDRSLRVIQGVRFYIIINVILGHRLLLQQVAPLENPEYVEQSYFNFMWTAIFNGHLIVTTFFVISGFVLSFLFFQNVSKKTFDMSYMWKAIILRYLRLTPPYAMTVAVAATLAMHLGHGPLWDHFVGWDWRNCRRNWWANMLYINNYVHADDSCLLHTWYLAADLHLFVASMALLMAIWRWPGSARYLLGVCLVASCVIPGLLSYYLQLDPTLLVLPETLNNLTYTRAYLYSYVPTHMNVGPYVAGLLGGYLLYHQRKNDFKLPVWLQLLLWVMLGLALGTILSAYPFYQPWYRENLVITAVYQTFFRLIYGGGVAAAIFICATGNGWFFNTAFSWTPFQMLGRLSYCAYLAHFTLQKCKFGLLYYNYYVAEAHVVAAWFSDIVVAFLLGALLSMTVELPTAAICNMFIPLGRTGDGAESKCRQLPLHNTNFVNGSPDPNFANGRTTEFNGQGITTSSRDSAGGVSRTKKTGFNGQ